MNFFTDYSMLDQAGSLSFLWMTPSLPQEIKFISLALLAVLPLLFLFRGPAAAFADRHLHVHLTPRALAVGAPALSILCGVLLIFSIPREPLVRWNFNGEGVSITSLNGSDAMKWADVGSASFDPRNPNPDRAALVLKSKDGRELWLVLSWLIDPDREKVLALINRSIPGRFKPPVLSEKPPSAPPVK